MKQIRASILLITLVISMLLMTACNIGDVQDVIDNNTNTPLQTPVNLRVKDAVLYWNSVEYASGYTVLVNGTTTYTCESNSYSLQGLQSGTYTLAVKANGDGLRYKSSAYSDTVSYTRDTDTGKEYYDTVQGAFGSFDEINTRESYLGYGINIINANGITSQNIKLNYPIFSKDALLNEMLLKSNEHYSNLETIEASTIEEFKEKLAASTSISSGASVSASGNLFGVNASGGVSLSQGLKASFEKTSSETYSQYFLEIIAENQNYWLVLQTEESRYREILSEEFKRDLYNPKVTPAQLFDKYGTHLLTSVAMGGNISMFYTLYSTSEEVTSSQYYEVSSKIKAGVDASYSGFSAGVSGENSFAATFTHEEVANKYGIRIEKKIVTSGGSGSFGIINEQSLYNNYADWQASLDAYPVVIGIKDSNSLYPIWNLIDTSVEGGAERYAELYEYFTTYGVDSYNELVSVFGIQPPVAPTEIINIRAKTAVDYREGDTVQVKPGDTFKITFDVLPLDATKYQKTFYIEKNEYVTIDEGGNVAISQNAPGRMSFTVTVTAGNIERDIEFYVVQSCTVMFNTGLAAVTVPNVVVESASFVEEPVVERVGYTLEGWYLDMDYTRPFDFENSRITSTITLYAKWKAIEPIVTFDSVGGSDVTSQLLKYNGTAKVPSNPTRDGYTFLGWYTNRSNTEPFDFATKITEDTTIYAGWELIVYTVTFDSMGGVAISPKTTHINAEYLITEVTPERTYYTFDGWYCDTGYREKFYFDSKITKDITLYAKWTPISAYVSFVNVGGGMLYDEDGLLLTDLTTNITKNFLLENVRTPVREGYTFVGWKYNGQLVDLATQEFLPTPDGTPHVLVATWTVNSYTLEYRIDGDKVAEFTYEYGAKIDQYTPDEYTGYHFNGWDSVPKTMPAKSVIVNGSYSVNTYTITYVLDGVQYGEIETLPYGAEITVRPNPQEEYKDDFSGWEYKGGAVPKTMPAENIIITGVFGSECYEFNCYVDGERIVQDLLVKVNTVIPVPEAPTKTGYDFIGWTMNGDDDVWFEEGMLMPSDHVELYAQFALKKITVTVNYVFDQPHEAKAPTVLTDILYGEEYSITIEEVAGYTANMTLVTGIAGEENIELTVIYSSNTYTLTVQYVDFDGSVMEEVTAEIVYKNSYSVNVKERTGYTATVEDEIEDAHMPAHAHAVIVRYTKNAYKISVFLSKSDHNKVVGNVTLADSYLYGEEYSIALPDEVGYTAYVDGTATTVLKGTVGAANISIEVVYKPNTYTVSYVLNGSDTANLVASEESYKLVYNATSDFATAYNAGYTFEGWCNDKGVKIAKASGELISNVAGYTDAQGNWIYAADLTLYGKWTANTYIITYDANGGTVNKSTEAKIYGMMYDTLPIPTRVNCRFDGWYVGDTKVEANSLVQTAQNHELVAHWTPYASGYWTTGDRDPRVTTDGRTEYWQTGLNRDALKEAGYTHFTIKISMDGKHATNDWWPTDWWFEIYDPAGKMVVEENEEHWSKKNWETREYTYTISLDAIRDDGTIRVWYDHGGDSLDDFYLGKLEIWTTAK